MKTIILSAEDVRSVVARVGLDALMDELIVALTEACLHFDGSAYDVPVRSGFHYSEPNTGLIEWMPALQKGSSATVKMVSYHPDNPSVRGLPTILSTLLIFDTESGHLESVMDSTFLTAVRTGAASAVASRVLAAPDSSTLGLIGCGAQAITQLHGLSRIFEIRKVVFFDVDPSAVLSFPRRARQLRLRNVDFEYADLTTVASEADVLCTCTSIEPGDGPVFADTELRPWIHVNAVGSDFPGKVEVPRSLLDRSLVVPDFLEQAVAEGECQQLDADGIGPDLVTMIRSRQQFIEYRTRPTVFDSTGWSLEDHVAGRILANHAQRLGVGDRLQLESVSDDPRDPYGFIEAFELGPVRKIAVAE